MSSCVTFWTNSRGVIYHSREDLCICTWPPEARLVALISGYFDDSQAAGDVWVVAGYVGYANQWDHFELLWKEVLQTHGVPISISGKWLTLLGICEMATARGTSSGGNRVFQRPR